MLAVYYAAVAALRAHAAVGRDADFLACLYFSLLGLTMTLAFLRLNDPGSLALLAMSQ